jgi:hypothetical protein
MDYPHIDVGGEADFDFATNIKVETPLKNCCLW